MNAEQLKKYDEIRKRVYLTAAECWLVAQLEAETQTVERLQSILESQPYKKVMKIRDITVSCLRIRIEAAEAEAAELHALFALQQTRMAEATKAWQAATGKRDVLPDLGDLLAWLMDRPAALETRVRELREAVQTALDWRGLDGDGITDLVALQFFLHLACLLAAT